jgi:hypothetical protein
MSKTNHQISDLRDHLFDQLDRLNDPGADLEKELKKAKAFVEIGGVLVNSAKVEVDAMKITRSEGSGFIPKGDLQLPAATQKKIGNGK